MLRGGSLLILHGVFILSFSILLMSLLILFVHGEFEIDVV